MGGQTSSLKGEQDLYGPFNLRQSQKFKLNILSDLITMIIGKNNLFDLAQLLNTPNGCKTLIVMLESKMKEEFTRLRFPDPEQLSKSEIASFLPIESYMKNL
jgi:hypothetical protein